MLLICETEKSEHTAVPLLNVIKAGFQQLTGLQVCSVMILCSQMEVCWTDPSMELEPAKCFYRNPYHPEAPEVYPVQG